MKVKRLNFKREYRKILESGRKITTIRIHTDLKSGDLVELVAGGVSCGYARVKSVTRKKVSELSKKDAVKDGFKNVKELLKVLKKYYREITPETYVYIIRFEKQS
ncbi:ASCH domain-containing protein [Candidatus Bathyarchaeota archaeon B24-2]|nr:MAG: ASCH domain-containing protein [Candidatus Bathyarchaeota archaeon B24-2]